MGLLSVVMGGAVLGWVVSLWLALRTDLQPAASLNMCAGGGGAALAVWLRQLCSEVAIETSDGLTMNDVCAAVLGAAMLIAVVTVARKRSNT